MKKSCIKKTKSNNKTTRSKKTYFGQFIKYAYMPTLVMPTYTHMHMHCMSSAAIVWILGTRSLTECVKGSDLSATVGEFIILFFSYLSH